MPGQGWRAVTRLQRSIVAKSLTPQRPLPHLAPSSGPQSLQSGEQQEPRCKETRALQHPQVHPQDTGDTPGLQALSAAPSALRTLGRSLRLSLALPVYELDKHSPCQRGPTRTEGKKAHKRTS